MKITRKVYEDEATVRWQTVAVFRGLRSDERHESVVRTWEVDKSTGVTREIATRPRGSNS